MFIKVYEQIIKNLKENFKLLIVIITTFLICTFEFPYYIDTPGGLININERIEVNNSYKSEGSFNLAYVSELKATIPTLLISLFNKDWDVVKEEDITYDEETIEEAMLRDKILLEESMSNATIVAYKYANKPHNIKNTKQLIMYVDKNAETTLKVGDELLEIEGNKITTKEDLTQILEQYKKETKLNLKIKRDNKETDATATLKKFDNSYKIGIVLSSISEITTTPSIKFKFKKQESGPSGGLMSALAIYNNLTEQDLTKGKTIVGTGTIELDGTVGSIGGVEYKIKGAVKKNADIFFVPAGENYKEALKVVNENNYKIKIVSIETFEQALNYLKTTE